MIVGVRVSPRLNSARCGAPWRHSIQILLIDDDELLAAPLAAFFKRFDVELASATRPSAGLALLRAPPLIAEPFDAVIFDVMLPEMDGFELCRTIRRESDVPVIMLTARSAAVRLVGRHQNGRSCTSPAHRSYPQVIPSPKQSVEWRLAKPRRGAE